MSHILDEVPGAAAAYRGIFVLQSFFREMGALAPI